MIKLIDELCLPLFGAFWIVLGASVYKEYDLILLIAFLIITYVLFINPIIYTILYQEAIKKKEKEIK